MSNKTASSKLNSFIKNGISDPALKKRLRRLSMSPLDTLIRESGVVLEDRIRAASGLKGHGVQLVDEALAPGKGRLVMSLHDGEQEGFRLMYRGAIQAIRNPVMHKLVDLSTERAIVLIRLTDSLIRLLPESDLDNEGSEFLRAIRKHKKISKEVLDAMLSTMREEVRKSRRLSLGYETVTANLYWLDDNWQKRRFFVINAKNGTARVWTDYLRKSGYNSHVLKLEEVAAPLLPNIRGQKSAAIRLKNANVEEMNSLIGKLTQVFA